MKFFLSVFVFLLVGANIAFANNKFTTSSPVMKIRFNTTEVHYHDKLNYVLEKVLASNNNARFVLVAVLRKGSNQEDKEFCMRKISEISKILSLQGIKEKNIDYKFISEKDILNNEIRIFLAI